MLTHIQLYLCLYRYTFSSYNQTFFIHKHFYTSKLLHHSKFYVLSLPNFSGNQQTKWAFLNFCFVYIYLFINQFTYNQDKIL